MRGPDPWAAPPPPAPGGATGLGGAGSGPGAGRPVSWGREILAGAVVMAAVAAAVGPVLGLLWERLAPRVRLLVGGDALYLENPESQQAIAGDGTFLLLGLGVGLAAGVGVFLLRRRSGVAETAGLALGAGLGAVLAWRLGELLEPDRDEIRELARRLGDGAVIDAPLELNALGALIGPAFGALLAHFLCMALWGPRDPVRRPPVFPRWG
ncbi:hypothetical protein SAMN05421773_105300 [Streptomyces aidingensis]|uniref:LPXTG-motif cell wall anchor domain-containing protein n=2 Tax=Streptomyces aidingensis TaxID=910347 RepID=A0A1I1LX96_9ACTN|nr:hypothetical protein SAMN05421773_105300 [Streptomyces aidingensis]